MIPKLIILLLHIYFGFLSTCLVDCAVKGSLVFVIDDTGSMSDEIEQVKQKTYEVFDAVLSSNGSAIDDFVLVTFNDPDTELRIATRDKYAYKREVENIQVHDGGDCEEYSMSGIELALENSKPNSFIYVFTDASAHDFEIFERVKSLSQKKSTQVTFLLTGVCDGTTTPDYLVFEKLAEATSGQVFNMQEDDVNKVIDYIIASIQYKRTTLAQKTFRSGDGNGNNMTFTVDSKIWDVIVSVSAASPDFRVLGPDNKEVTMEKITNTARISVAKLKTNPDNYTIVLNDIHSTPTSVIVTGSTSVTFQHGFSTFKPSTINETSTKPIPDQPSYLSIKLDNKDRDVSLKSVELLDEDDNHLKELLLGKVKDVEQFYTTEAFNPPLQTFKIAIHGYTPTGEKITRVSPTTVEYQKPSLVADKIKDIAPKVSIIGDSTVNVESNQPFTMFCKVMGYPKPDVLWRDPTGAYVTSPVNAVDLPYEYVGILQLAEVKMNGTVTCIANNSIGQAEDSVNIQVSNYLNVLEYPSDTTIEYGTSGYLKLIVDASPQATIAWYKDGEMLRDGEQFNISDDGSTLIVKHMHTNVTGSYSVVASNDFFMERFHFKIFISGTEAPKIDNSVDEYHVNNGSSVDLLCRITKGKPDPKLYWLIYDSDLNSLEEFTEVESSRNQEIYHIERVSPEHSGVYRCVAQNDIGEDVHDMYLFVEYPPVIQMDEADKIVKEGEVVKLPCVVDGVPTPSVRWFVNGLDVATTSRYKIYRDHTLSFSSTVSDSGYYSCEASNPLGVTRKKVYMDIFVPVNIESPKQSIIYIMEGNPLVLPCLADGYPKPNITWMFLSKDPTVAPRLVQESDIIQNSVTLDSVSLKDEGLYTCVASNTESASNITYEVHVNAPPTIVDTLSDKTYKAVKGDLVLRLPCKVFGSPKPTITWTFESGFNIVTGTEWYDVDKDGTLIIKNVDEYDAGSYVCTADNLLGSVSEKYNVDVLDSPPLPLDGINNTVTIEEGNSVKVDCGRPYQKSDLIRWFKNGKFIKEGDLEIHSSKASDSGIYSCRVSNFDSSYTTHSRIIVGSMPIFTSEEETNVMFSKGSITVLSCNADGRPKPMVRWRKDNEVIEETSMEHLLLMEAHDIGQYTCDVTNEFGTITRTFNIVTSKECLLDTDNNFKMQQPLLLSPEDIKSLALRSTDGLLRIPSSYNILMVCPNSVITIKGVKFGEHLNATCIEGSKFKIYNEFDVQFSEIRCNDKIVPLTRNTGTNCGPGKTELLNIGYDIGYEFMGIYDICFDKIHKIPLYAKHEIHPMAANALPTEEIVFEESRHLPFIFEDMYNCYQQRKSILSITGKRLSTKNKCCFAKKHLVNPRDVIKGYQQVATYNHLNVIPKWGTCGMENWDKVEERVRNLVKRLEYPLEVYTGASNLMKLPAQPKDSTVYLKDRFGRKQPVPRYIWKVIVNHYDGDAVAIIQINIPDITQYQAFSFMLCKDICHQIEWMRDTEWKDVNKGFTFCCDVKDFEKAFGYKDVFTSYSRKLVLRELSTKALLI